MENFFYFLVGGVAILLLILQFDLQQRRKIKKVLKDTKNVQPLFLLRSAEQKLSSLNALLYNKMAVAEPFTAEYPTMGEGTRLLISAQLGALIRDYNGGKISLKIYHAELNVLLNKAYKVSEMSLVHVGQL
jgi:hypothetical protein